MTSLSVRKSVLGLLLFWLIAPTSSRLSAADPAYGDHLSGQIDPASAGSDADTPAESQCIGLLEGSESVALDGVETAGYDRLEPQYEDCGPDLACGGADCGPSRQLWVRGDYLLWWTNGSRLPPLVTTSPSNAPPGVLGEQDTRILFGDSRVNEDARSSFRLTMGYWLNCCRKVGIEGDYFDVGDESTNFFRRSTGDPVLTRPFYTPQGIPSVELVAYPEGVVVDLGAVGDIGVRAWDYFQSTGARIRYNLLSGSGCFGAECDGACGDASCDSVCTDRAFRLDFLAGYRHYRLTDRVTIEENLVLTAQNTDILPGTAFSLQDDFHASNEFDGGELGVVAEVRRGRWALELLAKMAMGSNRQVVTIAGNTAITPVGLPTEYSDGGLLALPSNSGRFVGRNFAVIPQFGAQLGYQVTSGLRAFVGYDYLFWANVGRAGDQIDLTVNTSQMSGGELVGPARPAFVFRDADFWAQGLNVGTELCY